MLPHVVHGRAAVHASPLRSRLGRGTPMNGPDETNREIQALRGRISALSAAILRISASLDLATVLQEVVDSARALTGARYGVIATIDETGDVREFVTSGFTPDEHRELAEWPDGPRLFAHFAGPSRADSAGGSARVRPLAGLLLRADAVQDLPGHADASPRRACGQLLPRREGGGAGLHRRGRGGADALRLTGGNTEGGVGATGLGLAVCKGLVEAHGGRIRAESPGLGQGARFTFTLPVAESEDAQGQSTPSGTG